MNKISSMLILFLLTGYVSGQECKYAEYYSLTDEAKEAISKKNYKEAKKYFQLAFSETDFILGHDLSFALVTAIELKDDVWAKDIAERLAKGGVPLRYFSKFNKKKWFINFKSEFANYSDYYNKNFEPTLKQDFLELIKQDKDFTHELMQWHNREIKLSVQEATDKAIALNSKLKVLTAKYGFPGEQKMGYNFNKSLNRVENYNTGVLLIHLYKHGERIFEKDIGDIICDGKLHPNFQVILNQSHGFGQNTGIEDEMKIRYTMYNPTE